MTTLLQKSPIHRTVLNNGIVVLVAENPAADNYRRESLCGPVVVTKIESKQG